MTSWRAVWLAMALGLAAGGAAAETVILYAHADATRAAHARDLARALGSVWLDHDLRPGQAWRVTIGRRVCRAGRVLVLWSEAAAASVEVGAEWRHALACGRVVVPVLLDDSPLPAELGRRQAVDWRF